MNFHHIRHATSIVSLGGHNILIDPLFGPKGYSKPVPMTPNPKRNPICELPLSMEELQQHLSALDLLLVTHRHNDHYDEVAKDVLSKHIPVFCQPEDEAAFIKDGFTSVHAIRDTITFKGLEISRTGGQHGLRRNDLGPVSGFVLKQAREPVLYFAGDTVWCPEVEKALERYQPDIIVVNAGGARFIVGKPITMTTKDIGCVMDKAPSAKLIAVHMEALNHCVQCRQVLKDWAREKGVSQRLWIPSDGESHSDVH